MKFRNNTAATKPTTTNLAGGEAFKESAKLELISLLLTSMLNDKFYETQDKQIERLRNLVSEIKDKKFIGKASIYARNVIGMRSITHVLIVELLKHVKDQEWLKFAVSGSVKRPDDMLEMIAYYKSVNTSGNKRGVSFNNQLKKGLRLAVNKFDEYQLAKYKGDRSDVKLIDLLNIVRPKPNENTKNAFKKLVVGELKSTGTWERTVSDAGKEVSEIKDEAEKAEKFKELKGKAFSELVGGKKISYMALLKNLRNIIQSSDDETLDKALASLTNENLIKKSLVFPFRYSTAYNEILKLTGSKVRKTVEALSKAIDISLSNVPVFPGRTLIALDESGSMEGKPIQIGSLFASTLYKVNNADLLTFASEARFRNFIPNDSTLGIAERLRKDAIMGGTNFHSIFDKLTEKYDRIVILSDMQAWEKQRYLSNVPAQSLNAYKTRCKANPKIYSFDLNGYGSLQFPEKNIYCIAGFSDKILSLMGLLEEDRDVLINEIEKIEL